MDAPFLFSDSNPFSKPSSIPSSSSPNARLYPQEAYVRIWAGSRLSDAVEGVRAGSAHSHIQEGKEVRLLPHRAESGKSISAPYPIFLFIFPHQLFISPSIHSFQSLLTHIPSNILNRFSCSKMCRKGKRGLGPREEHGASLATSLRVSGIVTEAGKGARLQPHLVIESDSSRINLFLSLTRRISFSTNACAYGSSACFSVLFAYAAQWDITALAR
jgi:hypothetical protein